MKKIVHILFLFTLLACEEVIRPNLPNAAPVLAFDAFLFRKPEIQTIKITRTNTYFDSSEPERITGARVAVRNENGFTFFFNEDSAGYYNWTPSHATDTFGVEGESFSMDVRVGDDRYKATSNLRRVPKIDSLTWRLSEGEFLEESSIYIPELWATDILGEGDAYWIRSWENGFYLNQPQDLNISYDGAFSSGNTDGNTFIRPIREKISSFGYEKPELELDSIYVELCSITPEVWIFWNQVMTQTDRPGGFSELFAQSLANVDSNIQASTNENVVGFFSVSRVEGIGRRFSINEIREEK